MAISDAGSHHQSQGHWKLWAVEDREEEAVFCAPAGERRILRGGVEGPAGLGVVEVTEWEGRDRQRTG
jgi:hypothetical protein